MRFVKFGFVHVNPSRVVSVTDVYQLGEINLGVGQPIKTGLPTAQVIKMLEDGMADNDGHPPQVAGMNLTAAALRARALVNEARPSARDNGLTGWGLATAAAIAPQASSQLA